MCLINTTPQITPIVLPLDVCISVHKSIFFFVSKQLRANTKFLLPARHTYELYLTVLFGERNQPSQSVYCTSHLSQCCDGLVTTRTKKEIVAVNVALINDYAKNNVGISFSARAFQETSFAWCFKFSLSNSADTASEWINPQLHLCDSGNVVFAINWILT